MIYADNNATTPCLEQVVKRMHRCLQEVYGNPSSRHYIAGRNAAAIVEEARQNVADLMNCEIDEITFTSGATEALNQCIFGVATRLLSKRPRMICAATEHPAVLEPVKRCAEAGADLCVLSVDQNGLVNLDELNQLLQENATALVCVMLANNETGVINDIQRVCELSHEHGALVLCDLTAGLGKCSVDVEALGCDFAAATAHKINGPKGIGFLYKKRGLAIDPLIYGGGQEQQLRSGTENIPGLAGLSEAVKYLLDNGSAHREHLRNLHQHLEQRLKDAIPNLCIHGQGAPRTPGCTMLCVTGLHRGLLTQLKTVAASAGSSCSSGSGHGSHVMEAMQVDAADANNSIRISLGHFNTINEVDQICDELIAGVKRLQQHH